MPLNEQTNIHKNIEKTLYHLRMYSIKVYRNIGMQGVQELFFCYPKGPGGSSNKFHFKCCNLFLIMESWLWILDFIICFYCFLFKEIAFNANLEFVLPWENQTYFYQGFILTVNHGFLNKNYGYVPPNMVVILDSLSRTGYPLWGTYLDWGTILWAYQS